MRVCYEKATGRIIETQSGGELTIHLLTLVDNAVRAGYKAEEITCEFMDEQQYANAQLADPYLKAEKDAAKGMEDKLRAAKVALKVLISTENPDATKWKIEEVVAHLREIERIINIR